MNQPLLGLELSNDPKNSDFNPKLLPHTETVFKPTEERIIKKHFKCFYKKDALNKFQNFFSWMESPKEIDLSNVYKKIKDHYFSYHGPDGLNLIVEEFPIFDFVISDDDTTMFIACGSDILIRNGNKLISKLQGHSKDISCLALRSSFNEKSQNLFSGGLDNDVIMWNWVEESIIHTFKIHKQPILSILVSEDKLFSAGEDKFIIIHSLHDFSIIFTLKGHYSSVNSIALNSPKNTLFSAGSDKNIIVWDLAMGIRQKTLKGHTEVVTSLSLSPSCNFLASGSHDKTVKIWNLENYEILICFTGHENYITKIIWSSDGKNIISGSFDKKIRIWNLANKMQFKCLESHDDAITCLRTSKGGKRLISSSFDGKLKKWNILENIEKKMQIKVEKENNYLQNIYNEDSNCIILNKKGTKLFSGNNSNKINIWSIRKNLKTNVLEGHNNQVSALILNSEETQLISGSHDHTIRIWDWKAGKLLKTIKKFSNFVSCLALSSDGKYFAAGSFDKTACVYELNNLDVEKYSFNHSKGKIHSIIFSADGSQILTGNDKAEICIYRLEEGIGNSILIRVLKTQGKLVSSLIIATDSNNLISASHEGKIELWNINDYSFRCVLDAKAVVLALASSGSELISGGPNGTVHIWNLETYKEILQIQEHTEKIKSVAIAHDLSKIFCASKNKTIISLEWSAKKKLPFFEGHSSDILSLAVSHDGNLIATGGQDNLICLWDIQTLKVMKILRGSCNSVISLKFTPDSTKLVSATSNTDIIVWDIAKGKQIRSWEVESPSTSLIISHNVDRIIVGSSDCVIRIIDLKFNKENNQDIMKLEGHQRPFIVLDITIDDKTLFSGAKDGLIIKWNLHNLEKIKEFKAHSRPVTSLIIAQNFQNIFSGSLDGTVKIWNIEDLSLINTFNFVNIKIISLSLNISQTMLMVNGEDRLISLDLQKDSKIELPFKPKGIIQSCKFPLIENDNLIAILKSHDSLGVGVLYQIDQKSGKNVKTIHGNSNKITTFILSKDSSKLIFSDENNRIIYWDLLSDSQLFVHKGHTARINHMIEELDGKLVSCSSDKTIRIWNNQKDSLPVIIYGHTDSITSFVIHENKILSVSLDKTLRIWNIDNPIDEKIIPSTCKLYAVDVNTLTGMIFIGGNDKYIRIFDKKYLSLHVFALCNSPINNLKLSADGKILISSHDNKQMQIWDTASNSLINILSIKATDTRFSPKFLTKNHRYIVYANKIYDIIDDKFVFSFLTSSDINMCYFDNDKYEFYYLNHKFELWKLESFWLQNYFFHNINYDSLNVMCRNDDFLCSQHSSHYPFNVSFVHFAAIFKRIDCFSIEKLKLIYGNTLNLSHLYSLDVFQNTALDILLIQKDISLVKENMPLIKKYFDLVFSFFDNPKTSFYQKVRFLNYEFKPNYNILNIILRIIPLCNGELSFLYNLFEKSFLDIDPSIYNNTLAYEGLDNYILIETDSIFNCDHRFIEKRLLEKLKVKEAEKEAIDRSSIVKCKVICLPHIIDLKDERTIDVLDNLMNLDQECPMVKNTVFKIILYYIWKSEMQFYYRIDLLIFLFFFLVFNINFLYFLPLRIDPENIENPDVSLYIPSMVMDVLIILYSIYCLANEAMQFRTSGFSGYFKSIWNYFDITLIPLMMASSSLNMFITYMVNDSEDERLLVFKIVFAVCMFCFWFRFISFCRAFKETSYMIRLIFNVLVTVKYFVFFTILFILCLASTYYVLHNSNNKTIPASSEEEADSNDVAMTFTFWSSFYDFYLATLGDSSGIVEDGIIESRVLTRFFDVFTSFVFSIILMNLLVAIVWDKYAEIQIVEEVTRNFELMNIISDLSSSLTFKIVKKINQVAFPDKKYPKYLLYLYTDDNNKEKNKIEDFEGLDKDLSEKIKGVEEKINGNVEKIHNENQSISERLEEVEKIIKDNSETMKKMNDFLRTGGKHTENVVNELLTKYLSENIKNKLI